MGDSTSADNLEERLIDYRRLGQDSEKEIESSTNDPLLKSMTTDYRTRCVVAWRVKHFKMAARAKPDSPCSDYYSDPEWMATVAFVTRKPADSAMPPSLREFVCMVAQLGGYINKKSQGSPGSKTLWRGMAPFETIIDAYSPG